LEKVQQNAPILKSQLSVSKFYQGLGIKGWFWLHNWLFDKTKIMPSEVCIRQYCMGEFAAKTTVIVYGNKIYVCIKSSKISGSCNSGF